MQAAEKPKRVSFSSQLAVELQGPNMKSDDGHDSDGAHSDDSGNSVHSILYNVPEDDAGKERFYSEVTALALLSLKKLTQKEFVAMKERQKERHMSIVIIK